MAGFAKKKYFKLAKGFYGRAKNCFRVTVPRVEKSLQKAYVGRKLRKRNLRREWIQSINIASREFGVQYSQLICGLNRSNITLDRKILSQLSKYQPYSFKAVVEQIKLQAKITQNQRHHKLEQMIKRNLITSAKLSKQAYNVQENKTIKTRYATQNAEEFPEDFLQEFYKTRKL